MCPEGCTGQVAQENEASGRLTLVTLRMSVTPVSVYVRVNRLVGKCTVPMSNLLRSAGAKINVSLSDANQRPLGVSTAVLGICCICQR